MLNVTVRNADGQSLTGLNREAFELIDEKQARPLSFFENSEGPVSVGILVDTSESMHISETHQTTGAKSVGEAISHLLQLANPNNEYFLVAFDKAPRFLTDWKSASELLTQKTDLVEANRGTALFDACFAALDKLGTGHHPRRALILISDGEDSGSHQTFLSLRNRLKDSDLTLYAIGVTRPSDIGSSLQMEGAGILSELADVTGGELFTPQDKKQFDAVIQQIALELRHKYRIGFQPSANEQSHKWHQLKVRIKLPPNVPPEFAKVVIRTRQGYYTR